MDLWGGPSSGPWYSCVWAGASRREEKALRSQEGRGETRAASFVTPAAGQGDASADPHPERQGLCFFLKVVSKRVAALPSAVHRHSHSCRSWLGALPLQGVGAKGCVHCTTAGSCVWQSSCGRNLTVIVWAGSTGICKKRKDVVKQNLFFPFLCNSKTPEGTCYLCFVTLGKLKFEVTLFLTALCLVVDCYNCKVCHSFNFSFKTCFELAAYFLCLGQRYKFCAMKGRNSQVGEQRFQVVSIKE